MATKIEPNGYGVWDTETQTWWQRGNKMCWMSRSAGANAWNAETHAYWSTLPKDRRFSEQTRFVTKPIWFVTEPPVRGVH